MHRAACQVRFTMFRVMFAILLVGLLASVYGCFEDERDRSDEVVQDASFPDDDGGVGTLDADAANTADTAKRIDSDMDNASDTVSDAGWSDSQATPDIQDTPAPEDDGGDAKCRSGCHVHRAPAGAVDDRSENRSANERSNVEQRREERHGRSAVGLRCTVDEESSQDGEDEPVTGSAEGSGDRNPDPGSGTGEHEEAKHENSQ